MFKFTEKGFIHGHSGHPIPHAHAHSISQLLPEIMRTIMVEQIMTWAHSKGRNLIKRKKLSDMLDYDIAFSATQGHLVSPVTSCLLNKPMRGFRDELDGPVINY